jgi:hypothetical protein
MKPRRILPLILSLAVICLAGCATSPKQQAIAKMNLLKQGALACIMYADDHGGNYPPNLSAIAGSLKTNTFAELAANYNLVYTGAATNIPVPSETIIIREKQAWHWPRGRWSKAYAFADGHCELHAAPDEKFDDWENARIVKP